MNVAELIGRFHPLLVHLPIGFLMMGILVFWLAQYRKVDHGNILPLIFLLGGLSAALSCITGYALSLSGYEQGDLVTSHRNAAIIVSILSLLMWWLIHKGSSVNLQKFITIAVFGLLLITGHLGASITHGNDYLFGSEKKELVIHPIENLDEAVVYPDIVAPIFHQKCTGCHGPEKQKGKLRLDEEQYILKGGKTGQTVVAGSKDKSEMLKRILLPPDDEDHMPPKEKGQLTVNQKALIEWWIASGASFTKRVKEMAPQASIRPALASLTGVQKDDVVMPDLPKVVAASETVIQRLRNAGAVVVPISQHSNLLSVNLINCTAITDSMKHDLAALSGQLYWLKAEGPLVNDSVVKMISNAKLLRRLSLAGSAVSIESVAVLKKMNNLEILNLYNTSISKSFTENK